jgi:hypothetical protein
VLRDGGRDVQARTGATVDMVTIARPPTLPTFAAVATDPTPSTIVQKMIGEIIILIKFTNPVPSGLSSLAKPGKSKPAATPRNTTTITAMYR